MQCKPKEVEIRPRTRRKTSNAIQFCLDPNRLDTKGQDLQIIHALTAMTSVPTAYRVRPRLARCHSLAQPSPSQKHAMQSARASPRPKHTSSLLRLHHLLKQIVQNVQNSARCRSRLGRQSECLPIIHPPTIRLQKLLTSLLEVNIRPQILNPQRLPRQRICRTPFQMLNQRRPLVTPPILRNYRIMHNLKRDPIHQIIRHLPLLQMLRIGHRERRPQIIDLPFPL